MPQTQVGRSEDLLDELADWVRLETPTNDPAAINRLMDIASGELGRAGAELTRVPGRDGYGDTIIARTPAASNAPTPILVIGHLDTVWSIGTLAGMPFRVEGDRAYGPGIFDMKAGIHGAVNAVRAILLQGVRTRRPVTLMLTPDEEVGSPTTRALIEGESTRSSYVLITEPAGLDGACVTSRKGIARFVMNVKGRGSHAGGNFLDGASAVVELARQIERLHAMVNIDAGITVNVAPIWGGARSNVIAADAGCEIDLRVPTAEAGERMTAAILALTPFNPACSVHVTGGMNRPPFAETPAITSLYERARGLAAELGVPMSKHARGGGSDGNFTAALGIPTLDGLGCPGAGAHAADEHILWRELAGRSALMASLLETLD